MLRKIKGITITSFLFVLIVIGFAVKLAIPIAPVYFDHYTINNAMKALAKEPDVAKMSKAKVRDLFQRKLQVNNVKNVGPDDLQFEKVDGEPFLILSYEVRKHVIGNIDAVMVFKEQVSMSEKNG